jgi:hypothetical protein
VIGEEQFNKKVTKKRPDYFLKGHVAGYNGRTFALIIGSQELPWLTSSA